MTNFFYFNYTIPRQLFILQTDIKTQEQVETLTSFFESKTNIVKWSVDTEDVDNVLKIETLGDISENEIIEQIAAQGFYCAALPD